MEPTGHLNNSQHVIDLGGSTDASSSTSPQDRYFSGIDTSEHEYGPSHAGFPVSQRSLSPSSISNGSNSRNSPSTRLEEAHQHRNPLNSGFWISIELFLTINASSGTYVSVSRISGGENDQATAALSRSNQVSWLMNIRLTIVFLIFSCIGYAMPFILCATLCCCLPCIISILGVREDLTQTRGATAESINALPTYKFKMKKSKNNESNSAVGEGGILAAGTEKERVISGEDAACCICLTNYENDDELRELTCSHLFHKDCVDKWLKINAMCPLCKGEVGEKPRESSGSGEDAGQRVENENAPVHTVL